MREPLNPYARTHTHIFVYTHAHMDAHARAHDCAWTRTHMHTPTPLPRQAESLAWLQPRYHEQKLCVGGAMVEKHARWAAGAVNKHPEIGCCACGRWKLQLPDVSSGIMHTKALEGVDDAPAPTGSLDAQLSSIVHTQALEGVADEVPCWSTKSPNIPWGTSPFCPAWPRYRHDNGSTLTAEQRAVLRAAVRRAIAPFAQSGISREKCAPALSQRTHPLPSSAAAAATAAAAAAAATVTRAAHLLPAGCRRRCAPSARSGSACMCRS